MSNIERLDHSVTTHYVVYTQESHDSWLADFWLVPPWEWGRIAGGVGHHHMQGESARTHNQAMKNTLSDSDAGRWQGSGASPPHPPSTHPCREVLGGTPWVGVWAGPSSRCNGTESPWCSSHVQQRQEHEGQHKKYKDLY